MSKVQKVSIALTGQLIDVVQQAVASGQFASASEVVRDALRLWQKREEAKLASLNYMRVLIQEGLDSGPGEEWDIEKMKRELHGELAAKTKLKKSA